MSLTAKAFSREQFNGVVRGWYELGIIRFRLNPSGEGIYGEIDRDAYLPDPKAGKWDYYGSDLNCLILRFLQARTSRQTAGMTAAAQTYWDALCHTLPQTLLLVPVSFEGDPDVVEDMTLHLTKGAVDLIKRMPRRRTAGSRWPLVISACFTAATVMLSLKESPGGSCTCGP